MRGLYGVMVLFATMCLAAEGEEPSLSDPIAEKVAEFNKQHHRLKKSALQEMEKCLSQAKRQKGQVDYAAAEVRDIEKAIEGFKERNELPPCNALLSISVKYVQESMDLAHAIDEYRQKLKKQAVQIGAAALENLDRLEGELLTVIAGRKPFVAGSVWVGSAQNPQDTAKWKLTVERIEGNVFEGHLHVNPQHRGPEYSVEGEIQGAAIRFKLTSVLKAGQRKKQMSNFTAEGILLDKRLVANGKIATFGQKELPASIDLTAN